MIFDTVFSSTAESTSLPVITGLEGAKREWNITLRMDAGESSLPYDLSDIWKVKFICKTSPEDRRIAIEKDCEIINPKAGVVHLMLEPKDMRSSGLWWGAIQLFDNDKILVEQFKCWLLVRQTIDGTSKHKTLTVPEVRAFLFDRCAEDNRLLASTQFTDDEIMEAMKNPVDEWNSTPPSVCCFTTVNFPWRLPWMKGTAAYLLKSLAIQQIRNNATYQTGTVSVNDSDKGQAFLQIGEMLYKEWRDWLMAKKREINIDMGWGHAAWADF